LDLLFFMEQESKAIQFIEDLPFESLIEPQRQFGNTNALQINFMNQGILESIIKKHDKSNKIVFYRTSKLVSNLDMVIKYFADYS
jgi:hypothetical protein